MSKTIYVISRRKLSEIQNMLVEKMGFKLRYSEKKERIFSNDNLLVTCSKDYATLLTYDDKNTEEANRIGNWISDM